MKEIILRRLREQETVSGQELCEILGVSRTMVWKFMKQLKEDGYQIKAVSNKGYQLLSSPNCVTPEEIKSQIRTSTMGKQVIYYEEVNSTNTEAKRLAEQGAEHGTLVISELQKEGRGRRGKRWESQKGTGIWMSLIIRPSIEPSQASMLTLVTALAVSEGICHATSMDNYIKWPNDIIMNQKKVCGILTEMSSELDFINYIVIGIGINANTREFPEELDQIATSIYKESKKEVIRAKLIACIMEYFETYYEIFMNTKTMKELMELYHTKLIHYEKMVNVIQGDSVYEALALGINEKGELIIKTSEGHIENIVAGEVSVRGIYGYS